MEFNEKLQELRKQKKLTQEELAEILYVSRTAISKWESGRGYPNIESLKAISEFFSVSVDELLSGKELIGVAEKDSMAKMQHMRDLVFGLLDCAIAMFLFLPFFGQRDGSVIRQIPLLSLKEGHWFIKIAYLAIVLFTIIFGIGTLALQNYHGVIWTKSKSVVSAMLSISGVLIFMASVQPYAAFLTFVFLIIKGVLLIKRQ
jgi:transcriptional regulator with XRE-family HTH domain